MRSLNRKLAAVKSAKPRFSADTAHWLNPRFRYINTRMDSPELFRERMKERAERAKEQA